MPTALSIFPVFSVNFDAISLWVASLSFKQLVDISVSSTSPVSPNQVPAMDGFFNSIVKCDAALCFLDCYNFSSPSAQAPEPSVLPFAASQSSQIQCGMVLVFGCDRDIDNSSELGGYVCGKNGRGWEEEKKGMVLELTIFP